MSDTVADRAARVYRDAIVVDLHNDMPDRLADGYDPDVRHEPGLGGGRGHTDLPRLIESGITAQFFAAWVDAPFARMVPDQSFARAMHYLDLVHAFVARHPDRLRFATTAAEVRRAKAEGTIAVLLGVEGGHAIEDSLDNLRALHARGARYLTLAWNNGNSWAGSSIGVDGTRTAGLTDFGRAVIREMNRLGMLVDLSHVSDATFDDVVRESRAPVIASHSNARALASHPRNLTDDQLRAVARSGGVIGVNFYSRFLSDEYARLRDRIDAELDAEEASRRAEPGSDAAGLLRWRREEENRRAETLPPVPFAVLLDHIEHVAQVAGVDHVAIGSDFDGISAVPTGMEDVTHLPRIAEALLARGWRDHDVAKLLGANIMRVMEQVFDGASPG